MQRINADIQQVQAFIAVAERSSFRAAAEQLHLSPPALSRRIERLEAALGARLFHRTTRAVQLTGPGKVFLERARNALDDLDAALRGVAESTTQSGAKVTVACVPSAAVYFLPAVLLSFRAQHPSVRLRVIDESDSLVLQSVASGEADFGIGFMGTQVPEVDFDPIREDSFVLAVRREHPLARRRSVSWDELANENLMVAARTSGNRKLMDDALSRAGKRPAIGLEVSRTSTLLGMVEAGLGVGVVPRLALPPADSAIVGITLTRPGVQRTLGLLTRHGATLYPSAAALHQHFRRAFRAGRLQ